MTIWLTADLHLGHEKVAQHRGFDSVDDHDRAVITGWKDIGPDDQLWILGDLTSGSKSVERDVFEMFDCSPFPVHLILGNHDTAHPMHRDGYKRLPDFNYAFSSVSTAARRKYDGVEFLMSHFPYDGDHSEEDRHTQWRLRDEGLPIIHGHTHSEHKWSYSNDGSRQACVSLEAWDMKPARLEDVIDGMVNYL